MPSRRIFVLGLTSTGLLVTMGAPVLARDISAQEATAITEVFGDGLRFVAVAIRYSGTVPDDALSTVDFTVEDRTVTDVYAANSTDPADRSREGEFVIVTLSPEDANASLKLQAVRQEQSGSEGTGGAGGPGSAGDRATADTTWAEPEALVDQAALDLKDGPVSAGRIKTTATRNMTLDDFEQLVWNDPETGDSLPYNLYIPQDYDRSVTYPLVNFMHDAGATSDDPLMTLKQGLGAICWAGPADQAERPCFVLAPQYAEIIADDESNTSSMLDTTINLIKALTERYNIDHSRLYTTGQSGGGMMSIAMNIKYPDFFAASLLVACQWDASLVAPMAGNRLFILVSQDDSKAFPGQNAITEALEAEGATVAHATWDGGWSAEQFRSAFADLDAEGARVNYVTFAPGTVFEPGESREGASGHRNTWRVAYTIEPVREWLFRPA